MKARIQVLQRYKALLRAAETTFNEDTEALQAVRGKIRQEFTKSKNCDASSVPELLAEAKSAEIFIRGIVQAKMNHKGNYELRLPPDSASASSHITLEPFVKGQEKFDLQQKTSCCTPMDADGKSDCCK